MRILASVIHPEIFLIEIDLHTTQLQYHPIRPEFIDGTISKRPCRPFGITWDNDYIYVANNKRIHRFTADITYVDTIVDSLPSDSHQIIKIGNSLYVACTQADSIAKITNNTISYFNLMTDQWSDEPTNSNKLHVNALLLVDQTLYVNIGGREMGSHIRAYDFPSLACYEIPIFGGLHSHNIGYNKVLHNIDTGHHKFIRGTQSVQLPHNRFPRGLCITDTDYVIGAPYYNKGLRGQDSQLLWYNSEFKLNMTLEVPGEICDIRLLDEFDYAHYATSLVRRNGRPNTCS